MKSYKPQCYKNALVTSNNQYTVIAIERTHFHPSYRPCYKTSCRSRIDNQLASFEFFLSSYSKWVSARRLPFPKNIDDHHRNWWKSNENRCEYRNNKQSIIDGNCYFRENLYNLPKIREKLIGSVVLRIGVLRASNQIEGKKDRGYNTKHIKHMNSFTISTMENIRNFAYIRNK